MTSFLLILAAKGYIPQIAHIFLIFDFRPFSLPWPPEIRLPLAIESASHCKALPVPKKALYSLQNVPLTAVQGDQFWTGKPSQN